MQEIFCYLLNYYLSKFYFAFIFFFISIIFILLAYFFKRIKVINFILSGIFLALFIFEFTLASINPPLSDKNDLMNSIFFNNSSAKEVTTIRHIKEVSGKEYQLKDITKIIQNNSDVVFDVIYTTYKNYRFRYTKGNKDSNTSIVFLGCSLVFGHGVNDNQTLPYYFSKKYDFKYNVLNFGISGTGTNLALNIINSTNLINKFIPKKSKIKYFIYTVIDDHIERNFKILNFNACTDNLILVDGKFSRIKEPFGIFIVVFKKSYIFNKTFLNLINTKNRTFHEQYLINSILKIKNIVKQKYDAQLIVILWPNVTNKIIENLKEKNINVIALDKKFENEEYSIKNDGHPNWKANEEIAQILFDYINNKP